MFNLILIVLVSSSLQAAPLKSVDLKKELHLQILREAPNGFEDLVSEIQIRLGSKAIDPLFQIASDQKLTDSTRYKGLMAAYKIASSTSALPTQSPVKRLTPFLKDKSWMIRVGALKLSHLTYKTGNLSQEDFKMILKNSLKDPALLVRNEAVQLVDSLDVKSAIPLLLMAMEDPQNYHHGKPLMVPQKALERVQKLDPSKKYSALKPALKR